MNIETINLIYLAASITVLLLLRYECYDKRNK